MGLIEWYIKKIKGIDPKMVHPSIWSKSKREWNSLSSVEKDKLTEEWRRFNSRELEEKKSPRESVVRSGPFPIFNGVEITPDLRMDEIQHFLDLPEKERERQRREWLESQSRIIQPVSDPELLSSFSPIQLSLFKNPKVSTLLRALKKVSNVR
jgi:hypothetical protein